MYCKADIIIIIIIFSKHYGMLVRWSSDAKVSLASLSCHKNQPSIHATLHTGIGIYPCSQHELMTAA